ncbi:hypothetical protein [Streptomyces sp. NPDC059071]|uniref:hypothetical protein n=1 Tax=unclassified Streptomyces TaxID=2593676 RepID=UPI00364901B1
MSDTLLRALDLIQPGDLVQYHGSLAEKHGLYIAVPCACPPCAVEDRLGGADVRYRLTDPFADDPDEPVVYNVRRKSITRSTANA